MGTATARAIMATEIIDERITPERPSSPVQSGSGVRNTPADTVEPTHNTLQYRASLFAEKDILSIWFPQINDDENSKEFRIYMSRRSRALLLQIGIVSTVLTANVALTIFALKHYGSLKGVGLIYSGSCATIKTLDQYLHLVINLLSTGLLGASNYCMQLQGAPTRADVDRVHLHRGPNGTDHGKWLDIGVPSLRNLRHISVWRKLAWGILAVSSVPVHLIYNSAVFQSLSSSDYTVAVAKDSFLSGSTWNLITAEDNRRGDPAWDEARVNPPEWNYTQIIQQMQDNVMANIYQYENISSCLRLYDNYFQPQGNVVVIVKNTTNPEPSRGSLLLYVGIRPRSDDWAKDMWAVGNGTGDFVANSPDLPVTTWYLGPKRYEASHCLVQPPDTLVTDCRLEYSSGILITVCILNFTKALVMFCIWLLRKWQDPFQKDPEKQVLYTLGDAIASFMQCPDPSTKNMALATKHDFVATRRWKNRLVKQWPMPSTEPRVFQPDSRRWMAAGSLRRWIILLTACTCVIIVGCALLGASVPALRHRKIRTSIPDFWKMGFGELSQFTYLNAGLPREDPAGLVANVFLANLPQLVVSLLYIFYNSMISTFHVQREFSTMCSKRKTLRVSEPLGIQRSSYFISLPLKFGIPLYVSSGLVHWLLSQSLFLARITAVFPDNQVDNVNTFTTTGYSPIAIFITLLVGTVIIITIVLLGYFNKYDGTMRMVATNSRAISAACHVLAEDKANGYLLPVKWGVVEINEGIGKCAFTTAGELRNPEPGKQYR
ncbi:hypothetical protein GGR56DRAFT_645310 [Xylariaceae sp. FL0804]|nr:hypothetical protein GGR56DRAFT_645310 [Xylariaceae sp. FL0804]